MFVDIFISSRFISHRVNLISLQSHVSSQSLPSVLRRCDLPTQQLPCSILFNPLIGTARVVRGRGSMKRYGVRPSVCHSIGPQQQTRCCRFATVGLVGRRCRSIAAAVTG